MQRGLTLLLLCAIIGRTYAQDFKPLCQQYTLKQFDSVWFYKPDELGWTKGTVNYLWGYYPTIYSEKLNKTFEFNSVVWEIGNE